MNRFFSTKYTASSINAALFIIRVSFAGLMIPHGYDKLVNFASYKNDFMNFLGLGSTLSLALVVFSEFFCALFLLVGLFSRFVVIPLIISTAVALMVAHKGLIFGEGEHAALFMFGYIGLLIAGPGKASADGLMGK